MRRPDRPSLILFALAGFMTVLAVLALQVSTAVPSSSGKVLLLRRIYTTTVVETTVARGRNTKPTVTVQASAPPPAPVATTPAPVTRTSGTPLP